MKFTNILHKKLLLYLTLVGLSSFWVFGLASCKGKDQSKTVNGNKTLHRGIGSEPGTLDPHFVNGTWENDVVGDLFLGLLTEAADGKSIPAVAERWDISKDGKVYTFHLRKDVKWSDGEPVTVHDFVFAWRRILSPELAAKYANIMYVLKNAEALNNGKMKGMEKLGVQALNDYTLQATLKAPAPYFLTLLTHYTSYPLPQHVLKKLGKEWSKAENLVSNGPYKLAEWKSQNYIKAVKNEQFYDADNVQLTSVFYYPTEDRSAALKRFRAGELDLNSSFPLEQYAWLKTNMPQETRVDPQTGVYYYPLNQRLPKFQDKRVREALSLALDRETLLSKVVTTGEIPAYSFVTPMQGYTPAALAFKDMPQAERIKRAQKLLAEAGYSADNPLQIQLEYNTSENHKKIAIAIASMWKTVGIESKLFNTETAVHYSNMEKGNYEVSRAGWIADYPDAQNFLMLLEYPNPLNYGAYHNEEVNELMHQADITLDLKERARIMRQAEQIALDDYALIPIYYYVSKNLVSKDIKGWLPNAKDIHRSRWMSK